MNEDFYNNQFRLAINILNTAGVSMKQVPVDARREATKIEEAAMAARDKKDVLAFMGLVAKWKDLFLRYKEKKE